MQLFIFKKLLGLRPRSTSPMQLIITDGDAEIARPDNARPCSLSTTVDQTAVEHRDWIVLDGLLLLSRNQKTVC